VGIANQDLQQSVSDLAMVYGHGTVNMPRPVIVPRPVTSVLSSFQPVAVKEVKDLLAKLPGKHCSLDPAPTWLIKKAAADQAPVLCLMRNASLQSAKLASQKHAIVLPRLKKPTLDEADLNSYRPISNLSFISKLVERVVAKRYVEHAELNHLFPARQSAYRHHHSSETAVVSLVNDLIRAVDVDTVDHDCLLIVLHDRFPVTGPALDWFRSYLSERTQTLIGAESQALLFLWTAARPKALSWDRLSLFLTLMKYQRFLVVMP